MDDGGEAFDGALGGEDYAAVMVREGIGAEEVGDVTEVGGVGGVGEDGEEVGDEVG